MTVDKHEIGFFERYLTVWVGLCIVFGIVLVYSHNRAMLNTEEKKQLYKVYGSYILQFYPKKC